MFYILNTTEYLLYHPVRKEVGICDGLNYKSVRLFMPFRRSRLHKVIPKLEALTVLDVKCLITAPVTEMRRQTTTEQANKNYK